MSEQELPRPERLQLRFANIRLALEMSVGKPRADGAAFAAWLMAIQYAHRASMQKIKRLCDEAEGPIDLSLEYKGGFDQLLNDLEAESEAMLRSFHKELCSTLGIEHEDARELAEHFAQVINDICFQGG